ncbi:hypothetical protein CIT292_06978 [Citrobacter youngae ATCC 29220]|uniref:Uncharacterized protein n=1 Tax=Citrobacter youngae ATCC 29220 TaxID=500640 RepID=D4B940_9ENTR|nr:hypothetical protein CIT292_06978 [Citrobacter youngae ATCC 29220]
MYALGCATGHWEHKLYIGSDVPVSVFPPVRAFLPALSFIMPMQAFI